MGRRTDEEMRRKFYQEHIRGMSYAWIAEESGVSRECVRYWCRKQKKGGSVISHYPGPAPGLLQRFDPKVRYVVLRLRQEHPGWGPGAIRIGLKKRSSLAGLKLPQISQIGRYLHQFRQFRRKRRSRTPVHRPREPQYCFQRWQLDFKMGIPLADGSAVNLYTACDAFAGACIGAQVFPAGRAGDPPKGIHQEQVRTFLRSCFAGWQTLPEELQSDGEVSLAASRGPNDFPTTFTLWLEGLGIHHLVTRPHHPTDNAEVERMHRTVNNFALKGNRLTDLTALNAALAESVNILVYEMPSHAKHCHNLPPIQAYPELASPLNLFQPAWELASFDFSRVKRFLADRHWERRVGKTGQIDIGSHVYSVGRHQARKLVTIRYLPDTHELIVFGQLEGTGKDGEELKRIPLLGCDPEVLIGFSSPSLSPGPQQIPLPLVFTCCQNEVYS